MRHEWTSEAVTRGHPDKLCDQVADAILDACLRGDPQSSVVCKVTACAQKLHIMGEINSKSCIDCESIARDVIRSAGYVSPDDSFDAEHCRIVADVHAPSPDVDWNSSHRSQEDLGARDHGIVEGFACRDTSVLMPLPITLAQRLARQMYRARIEQHISNLLPDGCAQITVEYEEDHPVRISNVVISLQHAPTWDTEALREEIIQKVILPSLPEQLVDKNTLIYVNPTGRFIQGGPAAMSGLSGRKMASDTYGGIIFQGSGAFSGKDPTRMERSGAYLARYLAKNIVAAGLADQCRVQLAYAMGMVDPVSLSIRGVGPELHDRLMAWIKSHIDMRPQAVIRRFGLTRPIYSRLSCYGHFGENAQYMDWEQTDLAAELQKAMERMGHYEC